MGWLRGLMGAIALRGSYGRIAGALAFASARPVAAAAIGIGSLYGASRLLSPRSSLGGAMRGGAMYGIGAGLLGAKIGSNWGPGGMIYGGLGGAAVGGLFGMYRGVHNARLRSNRGY